MVGTTLIRDSVVSCIVRFDTCERWGIFPFPIYHQTNTN